MFGRSWEDVEVKINKCLEEDLEQVIRVQYVGELKSVRRVA
jgi:hypothetical protein